MRLKFIHYFFKEMLLIFSRSLDSLDIITKTRKSLSPDRISSIGFNRFSAEKDHSTGAMFTRIVYTNNANRVICGELDFIILLEFKIFKSSDTLFPSNSLLMYNTISSFLTPHCQKICHMFPRCIDKDIQENLSYTCLLYTSRCV